MIIEYLVFLFTVCIDVMYHPKIHLSEPGFSACLWPKQVLTLVYVQSEHSKTRSSREDRSAYREEVMKLTEWYSPSNTSALTSGETEQNSPHTFQVWCVIISAHLLRTDTITTVTKNTWDSGSWTPWSTNCCWLSISCPFKACSEAGLQSIIKAAQNIFGWPQSDKNIGKAMPSFKSIILQDNWQMLICSLCCCGHSIS